MEEHSLSERATDAAERYRTLLEINNAVISSLTETALFHAIAPALRRVIAFDRSAIFLHDPARNVLRLLALEASLPSGYFAVGLEMPPDESHVGWVFRHGRPLVRRDLATDREYPMEELALKDGVRSYVIVPLAARGKVIGTLALAHTLPGQYTEDDAAFLQEAANQIALAVENVKAYEELAALGARSATTARRYRTLLEINNAIISSLSKEALFRALAQALHRVVPSDRTAIFLHDGKRDVLRLFVLDSSLPSSHLAVGWEETSRDSDVASVFRDGQPLVRHDLARERRHPTEELAFQDGVRSYIVVPLVSSRGAIGTLSVASATPNRYSSEDAAFLHEAATQVALAVENMTAYEEIAALTTRLEQENVYLREEIHGEHDFVEIVGTSPALLGVLRQVEQVASTDSTVLISGQTGTGKELIARAIHDRSARKDRPLVKVNCSAISAGLVESELFGHVKGAFTGAIERRVGRFELADGGTIFLDEVGELPPETQAKLLRVLQEQEFEPVGSSRSLRVDVRVIAATNRDLEAAMRAGQFRADLFYRLNVFPLRLPPLRDRTADIPQLATFFVARFARKFGKKVDSVSRETMDRLVAYPWPGNIRELENVIERAVVLTRGHVLELGPELLPVEAAAASSDERGATAATEASGELAGTEPADAGLGKVLEETERRHIQAALAKAGGVIEGPRGAARLLMLHPNTLRSRMEKLGIKRPAPDAG